MTCQERSCHQHRLTGVIEYTQPQNVIAATTRSPLTSVLCPRPSGLDPDRAADNVSYQSKRTAADRRDGGQEDIFRRGSQDDETLEARCRRVPLLSNLSTDTSRSPTVAQYCTVQCATSTSLIKGSPRLARPLIPHTIHSFLSCHLHFWSLLRHDRTSSTAWVRKSHHNQLISELGGRFWSGEWLRTRGIFDRIGYPDARRQTSLRSTILDARSSVGVSRVRVRISAYGSVRHGHSSPAVKRSVTATRHGFFVWSVLSTAVKCVVNCC